MRRSRPYAALDLGGRVEAAHGLARRVWLAAAAITRRDREPFRQGDDYPDLVILFTTGYARGILHEDAELLAKPFTPEALASRMRDLIDRRAA